MCFPAERVSSRGRRPWSARAGPGRARRPRRAKKRVEVAADVDHPAARASGLTHGTGPSSAGSSLNVRGRSAIGEGAGSAAPPAHRAQAWRRAGAGRPCPPASARRRSPPSSRSAATRLPRTSSASTRAQHRSSPPRSRRRATNACVTPPRPRAGTATPRRAREGKVEGDGAAAGRAGRENRVGDRSAQPRRRALVAEELEPDARARAQQPARERGAVAAQRQGERQPPAHGREAAERGAQHRFAVGPQPPDERCSRRARAGRHAGRGRQPWPRRRGAERSQSRRGTGAPWPAAGRSIPRRAARAPAGERAPRPVPGGKTKPRGRGRSRAASARARTLPRPVACPARVDVHARLSEADRTDEAVVSSADHEHARASPRARRLGRWSGERSSSARAPATRSSRGPPRVPRPRPRRAPLDETAHRPWPLPERPWLRARRGSICSSPTGRCPSRRCVPACP